MPGGGALQLLDEGFGVLDGALAQMPSQHELRVPFYRDEAVRIAGLVAVALRVLRLLLAPDEAPDFVGLHVAHLNLADAAVLQALTFPPSEQQEREDRSLPDAGHALNASDAHALDQQM